MSLRPRYSLLTLLVFTALVAGGVKLWYGPHHVVVQCSNNWEREYTYTRDWSGNQIVHGPIMQRLVEGKALVRFNVMFVRHGYYVDWLYESNLSALVTGDSTIDNHIRALNGKSTSPLTKAESLEFSQACNAELKRLLETGLTTQESYEGLLHFHDP